MIAAPARKERFAALAASLLLAVSVGFGCRSGETKEGKHEAFNAWFIASADTYDNPPGHDVRAVFYAFRDYRRGGEVNSRFFPFFFHSSDEQGAGSTWVLPVFGHRNDGAERGRWWTWVAPLNFFGAEPAEKKTYAYAVPFWWSEQTPERDLKHLWPVYGVNRKGPEKARTSEHFLLSSLVRWEFDAQETLRRAWAIPFFGFERNGTHSRFAALGLDGLAAAVSRREDLDYAAADLFFLGRDREQPEDMAFFSAASGRWGSESGEFAALQAFEGTLSAFHRTWGPNRGSADLLSIGWEDERLALAGYATAEGGLKRAGVAPLFQWRRTGGGSRLAIGGMDPLLSLASLERTDSSSKLRILQAVGIPFFESARDGTDAWVGVLSLDARTGASLFSWRRRERKAAEGEPPAVSTHWHFFPFVFGGREKDLAYDVVVPLLFRRSTPEESVWITPLGGHLRSGETRSVSWILPALATYETDPAKDFLSWSFPWPLWYYERNGQEKASTFSLLPFYWQQIAPGSARRVALAPIFWQASSKDASSFAAFPLYFRGREKDLAYDLLVPLFLRRETPDLSYWCIPFAGHVRKGADRTYDWLLPPLFWRQADAKEGTVQSFFPWPVWGFERKVEAGEPEETLSFFPFYFQQIRKDKHHYEAVIPILAVYSHDWTPDATRTTVLPVFFHGRSKDLSYDLLLPVFLRREAPGLSYWFTPVAGHVRKGETDATTWVLPPLFYHESDSARGLSAWGFPWPLWTFDRRTEGEGSTETLSLLPFYWQRLSPDERRRAALAPLFWSGSGPGYDYLYALPFFGLAREGDGKASRWFVLGPLLVSSRDDRAGERCTDVLFPLARFSRSDGGRRSHARVAPFFFRWTDGDRETDIAMLLGGRRREGESLREWLLPFYFRANDAEGSDTFGTIFYRRTRKDSSSLWVFPTAYFSSSPDEARAHIWPFYGYDREGDFERRSVLAPLFFHGSDGKDRSETGVLFPLAGARREGDRSTAWAAPVFFRAVDKEGSDTFGTVFFRRTRKDASSLWVFPTAYFSSSPAESYAHVWPFFGYDRERDFERWSALSYLFFHGGDGKGRSETGFFFPLGGSFADEREATTWFFPPAFWRHREGGDVHWFSFWPLLDVETRADGYRKVSSFWYLYRRERTPEQTTFEHHVLFGLYHSIEDTKAGTGSASVALLFRLERTKEGRTFYLFTLPFLGIRF
ncbi:MAG: hypothetical protein AAB215_06170 [Planctomycetota bacterium]